MIKQIIILTTALLLAVVLGARAQSPGSESVYGGSTSVKSIISGGISSDVSESLYIGPGTHVIDGTWEIYAQRVIIDPLAVITGTGSIQIYNPGDLLPIYPAAVSMATLIDGNAPLSGAANNIDVNIQHFNNAGIQLTNMGFPSDLILDGWMNTSNSSSLYVGKDLSLEVDGADVTLGTAGVVGDLRFDADATISNYRPARMVIVNNSILSHMVKESFTSAFTFPVGIADGDYTPAQISNASSNTVRVSVQDYTNSASPEALADGAINLADGMNRTWHIYADAASISSTVNLQHNLSTNQSGFSDLTHFVTQWGTTTPNTTGDKTVAFSMSSWQTNTQAAGALGTLSTAGSVAGSSMRSRIYSSGFATTPTANESYFTKSADSEHPLPVKLISFSAQNNQCTVNIQWTTGEEDKMKSYKVQHSTDGRIYTTIASIQPKGSNSQYTYVHSNAVKGLNLYRLAMEEENGDYNYSNTQQLSVDCDKVLVAMNVYPNPTNGQITLSGMGQNNQSIIRVLNIHGRVVYESNTINNVESIDIGHLASATYLVQVVQNSEVKLNTRVFKN